MMTMPACRNLTPRFQLQLLTPVPAVELPTTTSGALLALAVVAELYPSVCCRLMAISSDLL